MSKYDPPHTHLSTQRAPTVTTTFTEIETVLGSELPPCPPGNTPNGGQMPILNSLWQTMLTRLGETGVDSFIIKKPAGHSSVAISEEYISPSGETMEHAFQKMETQNKDGQARAGSRSTTCLSKEDYSREAQRNMGRKFN